MSRPRRDAALTADLPVPRPAAHIPDEVEPGADRVLTVPNAVTLVRLLCIPLFVWLLFGAGRQADSAVLLAVLGATDWVDGYIARRFHQVSTIGKVLDPTADRLLVGAGVVAIVIHGAVPVWFAVATLAREVLVGGTVLALAALGARRIDVLWVGKAGTFGLMFAYPAFLLSHGSAGWQVPVHDIAWVTGGVGLVLAWTAAGSYIGPARAALREGRAGRRAGSAEGPAAGSAEGPAEG
ncbi:MAG: CDP-alcohol phosphatidyltransferase family protein [Acidimicrobiales bacterium]